MSPARWLIVVRRDKPEIYADLRRSFELDGRVEVVLDGRHGERRVQQLPVKADRRRRDRRRPLPATETAFADHAGFFVVVRQDERRPARGSRQVTLVARTRVPSK
jgi:hypothetical protein